MRRKICNYLQRDENKKKIKIAWNWIVAHDAEKTFRKFSANYRRIEIITNNYKIPSPMSWPFDLCGIPQISSSCNENFNQDWPLIILFEAPKSDPTTDSSALIRSRSMKSSQIASRLWGSRRKATPPTNTPTLIFWLNYESSVTPKPQSPLRDIVKLNGKPIRDRSN
jgi:hypothetical protein